MFKIREKCVSQLFINDVNILQTENREPSIHRKKEPIIATPEAIDQINFGSFISGRLRADYDTYRIGLIATKLEEEAGIKIQGLPYKQAAQELFCAFHWFGFSLFHVLVSTKLMNRDPDALRSIHEAFDEITGIRTAPAQSEMSEIKIDSTVNLATDIIVIAQNDSHVNTPCPITVIQPLNFLMVHKEDIEDGRSEFIWESSERFLLSGRLITELDEFKFKATNRAVTLTPRKSAQIARLIFS